MCHRRPNLDGPFNTLPNNRGISFKQGRREKDQKVCNKVYHGKSNVVQDEKGPPMLRFLGEN